MDALLLLLHPMLLPDDDVTLPGSTPDWRVTSLDDDDDDDAGAGSDDDDESVISSAWLEAEVFGVFFKENFQWNLLLNWKHLFEKKLFVVWNVVLCNLSVNSN